MKIHARLQGLSIVCTLAFLTGAVPSSDPPVVEATLRGDKEAVQALLGSGFPVNESGADGMTALHWAAEGGNLEIADLLVRQGADVSAVTRLGAYTPLHLASRGGHGDVVQLLLEAGGDPGALTDTGGVTPLHFAAGSGTLEGVAALLDHGADPNAREKEWEQTPLMFAAAHNRAEAIQELLQRGADVTLTARVVDLRVRDRIVAEVRRGMPLEAAKELIEKERQSEEWDEAGLPVNYTRMVGKYGGLTALLMATREGHRESVRALLGGGAEIDQQSAGDGTSPLLMATINGRYDLARELLDRGADPTIASVAGATPLYTTINTQWIPATRHPQHNHYLYQETSYLELMEALLEAGADPNVQTEMALWYTTFSGGGNLGVDQEGATPFWRAAHALDVEAMRLLLRYEADPHIPTRAPESLREGRNTQGYGAQWEGDASGLPPTPPGGPGHHPIHAAAGVGYARDYNWDHRHAPAPDAFLRAVRFLVEEVGADVNARDHYGYGALHGAAARGDDRLIEYLVEQGADVTVVSRSGETTADSANAPYQRAAVHPGTIRLLISLGAGFNDNCVGC